MNTVTESVCSWADRADENGLAAIEDWPTSQCVDDVDALDRLVLLGLADVLASTTAIARTGGTDMRASIESVGVCEGHRWVVERWIGEMVDAAMVEVLEDGRVRLAERPRRGELTSARERMVEACTRMGYSAALPNLLLDSLRHAVDMLRGRVSVQAILYPDGDGEASLEVYGGNVVSRYLNAAAASVVTDLADVRGAPLRILELGAGVGATSEPILQALGPGALSNYVFTDVSPHVLRIARERFADRPWTDALTFATLDITETLTDQLADRTGNCEGYDIVLAATMAHNAIDVDALLRESAGLLAPGGIVVLIETVVEHAQSLTTMPFALSTPNGSGPPARTDVRAGSHRTYLTAREWTDAFTRAGLRPCIDLPRDGDPLEAFSQRLLVAIRSDAPTTHAEATGT
ncbi:MAG: class I SAM-dependent methyltransferase [Rhodococcus sp. (in: high G+C Gram-positive bacteria)]